MSPRCEWCSPLWRTFSRYPSGSAGIGLLVLRLVAGSGAVLEAALQLSAMQASLGAVMAAAALLAGGALVLGFMTPVAGLLLAVQGMALLGAFSCGISRVFDSRMALIEFVAIAVALAIVGPGSTSIDARLFGLREVAISDKKRLEDS